MLGVKAMPMVRTPRARATMGLRLKRSPTMRANIGPAAAIAATADEIGRACEVVGFFYISNHGVPQALIDRTYDLSRRFHSSPTSLTS
jgi:hypothetical protein